MTESSDPARRVARILSVAGSDSGGGAGIQADIKTITMMGGHAMTAITAVTAQNSRGVTRVDALPAEAVLAQIAAVVEDFGVDAVKIGMLGSAAVAEAIANYFTSSFPRKRESRLSRSNFTRRQGDAEEGEHPSSASPRLRVSKKERERDPRVRGGDGGVVPIVFDPVMVATSGAALADAATIAAFGKLMDLATLTTPNRAELAALGGEEAVLAHGTALLIKGGHDGGDTLTDRLLLPGEGEVARWSGPRIDTPHAHGTGCTLSSAIATAMGQGAELAGAVERARLVVRLALHGAPGLVESNGPMGHAALRNDAIMPGPLLNQITIGCSDYAASVAFYRALGLTQIVDSPPHYARFEAANGATLSIHESDTGPGAQVVYLEHPDLDRWCRQLAAQGLEFQQLPADQSWGWREARLPDPHGNIVCLYRAGENRRYPPWRIGL